MKVHHCQKKYIKKCEFIEHGKKRERKERAMHFTSNIFIYNRNKNNAIALRNERETEKKKTVKSIVRCFLNEGVVTLYRFLNHSSRTSYDTLLSSYDIPFLTECIDIYSSTDCFVLSATKRTMWRDGLISKKEIIY